MQGFMYKAGFVGLTLALMPCVSAQAKTLTWTGASTTSSNFSDAANWVDETQTPTAPATGDKLVFQGETRTAIENDLDPALYTFKGLTFSNDNTTGKCAGFTFTGNKLMLSAGIVGVMPTGSTTTTDTFDLEIEGVNGLTMGGTIGNVERRTFVFKKSFTLPQNQSMWLTTQFKGTLTFEGSLIGFSSLGNDNGNVTVNLFGDNSNFTGSFYLNQGYLVITNVNGLGSAKYLKSGQGSYDTAGGLIMTLAEDATFPQAIYLSSTKQEANGFIIESRTDGTTATFTGEIKTYATKNNAGSRLYVKGAGNTLFSGNVTTANTALYKDGTGTMTLAPNDTCAMTGLVTVAAGKLILNRTLQPSQSVLVKKNATLAGTGTLSSKVTFNGGAIYEVTADAEENLQTLTIPGTATLDGKITVNLVGTKTFTPGVRVKLLGWTAHTGAGLFVRGTGFPSEVDVSTDTDGVYAMLPQTAVTWTDDAGTEVWNTSDLNWAGGAHYVDGLPVVFPDLTDAQKRSVSIPADVKPYTVTFNAQAERGYVLSGAGALIDTENIVFNDTATNTLEVDIKDGLGLEVKSGQAILKGMVENTPLRTAENGSLAINGVVKDSTIYLAEGSTFVQDSASRITGTSALTDLALTATLCGTNDFTGGITVGVYGVSDKTSRMLYAKSTNALGNCDITLNHATLEVQETTVVSNRTLTFYGYNTPARLKVLSSKPYFEWAGDIVIDAYPSDDFIWSYTTMVLGKRDGSTTMRTIQERNMTIVCENGHVHIYSGIQFGTSIFGMRGNVYLYNTNNMWGRMGINVGRLHTMAPGVLPMKPVSFLQRYMQYSYTAELDLHGNDQRIPYFFINDFNPSVPNYMRILSDAPATLTLSPSNAQGVTNYAQTVLYVKGAANLELDAADPVNGSFQLGCSNSSTGHVYLTAGTLKLANGTSLPVGTTSTLFIQGGELNVAEGVEAVTPYAQKLDGGHFRYLRSGRYGGEACTVSNVRKVDWMTGKGTLLVKRSVTGTVLTIR